MNNELSDFTIEKNDGACDTYSIKELSFNHHNAFHIICPKCGKSASFQSDNTYICSECKHIFNSEKFILD